MSGTMDINVIISILALLSGTQTGILISIARTLGKMDATLPEYNRRITDLERKHYEPRFDTQPTGISGRRTARAREAIHCDAE